MSEVKYKAVFEIEGCCVGCVFDGTYCDDMADLMVKKGLPDCEDGTGYIYQLATETNTSKVTLEQAREKFEVFLYQSCVPTIRAEFPKDVRGNYKFSTDQMKWEVYQQALKDHGILEEGE